jgi:hypothetical protein
MALAAGLGALFYPWFGVRLCESQEKYPKNARKASCLMQSLRHTGFCPAASVAYVNVTL